jgi:uncharacterized protein YdhG (YjbR/CyaY superfamily)
MQSKATTVAEYLESLPADRRAAIEEVRQVILKNLDADYEEGMSYGMISYHVPHRVYPGGYHCDPKQPLPFLGLASQKGYMSLYLMCVYGNGGATEKFQAAWARTGKKLDMGKACIRFKKTADLALDVIGSTIKAMPAKKYIALVESQIATRSPAKPRAAKQLPTAPSKKKSK